MNKNQEFEDITNLVLEWCRVQSFFYLKAMLDKEKQNKIKENGKIKQCT